MKTNKSSQIVFYIKQNINQLFVSSFGLVFICSLIWLGLVWLFSVKVASAILFIFFIFMFADFFLDENGDEELINQVAIPTITFSILGLILFIRAWILEDFPVWSFFIWSVILSMMNIKIEEKKIEKIMNDNEKIMSDKEKIRRQKEEIRRQKAYQASIKQEQIIEQKKILLEQARDAEQQDFPYTYQIGKHANEALAIRYGIANTNRDNSDASTIELKKLRMLEKDIYLVELISYRNRKARAVIEFGTEYVKTFYPLKDEWFKKYDALELTLKGNGSFTLKELAFIHVQKVL